MSSDTILAPKVRFVNLAQHGFYLGDGLVRPKAAKPTRVLNGRAHDGTVDLETSGEVLPIYHFEPEGQIGGLPEPEQGLVYIVSPHVRKDLTQRGLEQPDVVSPYAAELRIVQGRYVPCATALAW